MPLFVICDMSVLFKKYETLFWKFETQTGLKPDQQRQKRQRDAAEAKLFRFLRTPALNNWNIQIADKGEACCSC